MASFSEGFSRGFSLVDKVMAREQEEERQKRLEAESKRSSLERESQGRQSLAQVQQKLDFDQEVKWVAEDARKNRRIEQTDQSLEQSFIIAGRQLDQGDERLDNEEIKMNRALLQQLKENSYRDLVFDDSKDRFRQQMKLKKDKFSLASSQWQQEFDQNKSIQDQIQTLANQEGHRKQYDWDRKNVRILLGTGKTVDQQRAHGMEVADSMLELSEDEMKLKENAAILYMETALHNRAQDKIMNAFTMQNYNQTLAEHKDSNQQFWATLSSSNEHTNRSLAMQEAFIGVDGQIKKAELARYLMKNQQLDEKLDETAKSFFLSQTVVMDPKTGGISSVNLNTPEQVTMFQEATGMDVSMAFNERQNVEAQFAVINQGDFGSPEFKKAINSIYGQQINKPVGTTIQRDIYSSDPMGKTQEGEDQDDGWGLRDSPILNAMVPGANAWSLAKGLMGDEPNKNPGVNLKGGKILQVEFDGVMSGTEGGQGGMNGVPMMKTYVLKDKHIYSYSAPMTQQRSSAQGDNVAQVSMGEFVKKAKGMEQVMGTVALTEEQKHNFDNSQQGAAFGAKYVANRTKLNKAALLGAGYDPTGKSAKAILDNIKAQQTITSKGLKQFHTWLGKTGKGEVYFNDHERSKDISRILGSLSNVSDKLKAMNINPDWTEMNPGGQREIINAFWEQKAAWGDNLEDHAEDAYLQNFVNLLSKDAQGDVGLLGGAARKKGKGLYPQGWSPLGSGYHGEGWSFWGGGK